MVMLESRMAAIEKIIIAAIMMKAMRNAGEFSWDLSWFSWFDLITHGPVVSMKIGYYLVHVATMINKNESEIFSK